MCWCDRRLVESLATKAWILVTKVWKHVMSARQTPCDLCVELPQSSGAAHRDGAPGKTRYFAPVLLMFTSHSGVWFFIFVNLVSSRCHVDTLPTRPSCVYSARVVVLGQRQKEVVQGAVWVRPAGVYEHKFSQTLSSHNSLMLLSQHRDNTCSQINV